MVRFGVLGCAEIALRKMLPTLAANDAVCVTAIASRDLAKATRVTERFGGDAVHGYAALLERSDVDAVYLPLPAMLHADWTERALRAGKHVLVEKPMTATHRRTAELVELARSLDLVLLENFMFLHHAQHAGVDELVADGRLGALRGFASAFTVPPRPATDIRYQPEVGGGALLDVGVYPIRAALRFLGPDLTVLGAVLRRDRRLGVDISGSALLTTPDGVTAQLIFGMDNAYRCDYELSGSARRLWLDRAFTPPEDHEPVLVLLDSRGQREELTLPPDHQFANVLTEFLRLVTGGADTRGWAAGSVAQARLVDQIRDVARIIDC